MVNLHRFGNKVRKPVISEKSVREMHKLEFETQKNEILL